MRGYYTGPGRHRACGIWLALDTAHGVSYDTQHMTTTPLIENVKKRAHATAGDDEQLDFYAAARTLGSTEADADWIDQHLTIRQLRAAGAI